MLGLHLVSAVLLRLNQIRIKESSATNLNSKQCQLYLEVIIQIPHLEDKIKLLAWLAAQDFLDKIAIREEDLD